MKWTNLRENARQRFLAASRGRSRSYSRGAGILWPAFLLFAAAALILVVPAGRAADFYVDNETGNDNQDGSRTAPFRTITFAINKAVGGDTINLVKTATPYCESVGFQDKSGEAGKPIIFDGHGATVSGLKPITAEQWTKVGDGLYRSTDQFLFPERILRRNVENDEPITNRWFFVWNGKMIRMGRSQKGGRPPYKKIEALQPGEWTFIPDELAFYIKTAPQKSLANYNIQYPSFHNGIAVVGRCEHLVIKNLTVTHVFNDGISMSGYCRDVKFENIRAVECGDDGMSAHADNRFEAVDFTADRCATGIAHFGVSQSVNRRMILKNSHGVEIMVGDTGRHELIDSVIFAKRAAVHVYSPEETGAIPEGVDATAGVTLVMKNVWISSEHSAALPYDHPGESPRLKPQVEVWDYGQFIGDGVHLRGVGIETHRGHAKVSLTNSTISTITATEKPKIIITGPDDVWAAGGNTYDIGAISFNGTTYHKGDFAAYQKATGQDAKSRWGIPALPPGIEKLPVSKTELLNPSNRFSKKTPAGKSSKNRPRRP